MTRSVLILLGLAACAPHPLPVSHLSLPPPEAYRPAEADHTWTLQELLETARTRSPALRAAQHGVEASEAAILSASAVDNPQLRIGASRLDALINDLEVDIDLRVSIPNPLQHVARIRAARALATAAEADREHLTQLVLAEVAVLFHTIAQHQRAHELWTEHLAAHDTLVNLAEQRATNGLIPRDELVDVAERALEARQRAGEAADIVRTAGLALRRHLGWLPDAPLTLAAPAPLPDTLPEVPSSETVPADHAANRAAAARLAAAEADRAAAAAAPMPWFDFVQAGAEIQQGRGTQGAVVVGIQVPLWAPGHGPTREARAAEAASRAMLDDTVLETAATWHAHAAALDVARERYVAAREHRDQVTALTPEGALDPWLTARLVVRRTRAELAVGQAGLAWRAAQIRLETAQGTPSDP